MRRAGRTVGVVCQVGDMASLPALLRRPIDGLARITVAPGAPITGAPDTVPPGLVAARNASLTTYRRDGTPAARPVWFTVYDGRVWVVSGADAFKVRHLRRDARAALAPCRRLGEVTGPAVPATGTVYPTADEPAALAALARRYGWQMSGFLRLARRRRVDLVLIALAVGAGGGLPDGVGGNV